MSTATASEIMIVGHSATVPFRIAATSATAASFSRISGGSSAPHFHRRYGFGSVVFDSVGDASMSIRCALSSLDSSGVDIRFLGGSPAHHATAHEMSVTGRTTQTSESGAPNAPRFGIASEGTCPRRLPACVTRGSAYLVGYHREVTVYSSQKQNVPGIDDNFCPNETPRVFGIFPH